MNPSGKATSRAPRAPASAISEQAFSTVAARSRKTGAACTAATRKGASLDSLKSPPPGPDLFTGVSTAMKQHVRRTGGRQGRRLPLTDEDNPDSLPSHEDR